jgi:hypothetical protein
LPVGGNPVGASRSTVTAFRNSLGVAHSTGTVGGSLAAACGKTSAADGKPFVPGECGKLRGGTVAAACGIVCAVDASIVPVTRSAFVASRKSSTATRGRVGVSYIAETVGGGRFSVGVPGVRRRARSLTADDRA